MAKAKNLPVYKEAQRLAVALHAATRKAPREFRYTLIQRLLSESIDMIVEIDAANRAQSAERLACIEAARRGLARADVMLAIAYDQRCLPKGAMAKAMEHIDSIGGQLHGWALHCTQ